MSALGLPALIEANEPPEARGLARDGVRLLVADQADGTVTHARFDELPRLLSPGDLVVVNTSATLAAALPAVSPLSSPAWAGAAMRFYLDDRAAKNSGAVALPARRAATDVVDVAVAIGPEGGFTDTERRALEDARGTALRLGGRVLRAETAVFVGLTLLQHLLGDLAIT